MRIASPNLISPSLFGGRAPQKKDGSCTCTQCCDDECAFAATGKTADEGSAPGAAADEGRGSLCPSGSG
jgi:hypothetical protein